MHPIVSWYVAEERNAELRRLAQQARRHRRANAPRWSLRRWLRPHGRRRDEDQVVLHRPASTGPYAKAGAARSA